MGTKSELFSQLIVQARTRNFDAASEILKSLEQDGSASTSAEIALLDWIKNRYEPLRTHISDASQGYEIAPSTITGDQPGVSLVTCAMNRTENLISALQSWLALNEISEIIVVDWTSNEAVRDSLTDAGITDSRIRVIRVEGESRWILSYAFNIGFRYANYDKILKADADIVLSTNFFEENALDETSFISGFWEDAEEGQEHINGFFYVNTTHLGAVKGFNEFITTYGWDDDDLYSRLSALGLGRKSVSARTVHHLDHSDEERIGATQIEPRNAWEQLERDTLYKIRRNRFLSAIMPKWDENREFARFRVCETLQDKMSLRRDVENLPHVVTGEIERDADFYAAMELISWQLGPQAYHLPRSNFEALLAQKKREDLSTTDLLDFTASDVSESSYRAPFASTPRAKFFVDAQHGLGNRLRAIASGAAIANRTDRELVVVWHPDHHCECEMRDLFDYVGPVISESFVADAPSLGIDTYNYMESEGGEKDKPIQLGSGDIYFRGAFVAVSDMTDWDEENRFLKSLIPAAAVRELVAPFNLSNHVAAHIRMEGGAGLDGHEYEQVSNWTEKDHELLHYWREKSNFKHFITHIDKIFEQDPSAKLFLATDMQQTYDIFQGYYGDKLAFLSREVYDRSKEQIIYALADAILLSRCKRLLGSTWSSFSEMAMRLTGGYDSIEMSGEDF
ncbi:MAG: glycosyltransferase [Hyphomonas sp.]|nr:glycosyltransferase [Hyphomonas sp.]